MKFNAIKRKARSKGEINKLRREGYIPAVMYHNGKPGDSVAIKDAEYQAFLRGVRSGHLSVQKITLAGLGKDHQVIIKEIQYHPTTYKVLHLDFEMLDADVPVSVKVPIECTGVADCVGIKLGGNLRQVTRHVKVRCLPKHIPAEFSIDVAALPIGGSRRLKELAIPNTVKPMISLEEVAVTISKR